MKTKELNELSSNAALRVFPYTDKGNVEDDIDSSKRNIYQHGFIEGYTVANESSSQCVEAERKRIHDNMRKYALFDNDEEMDDFVLDCINPKTDDNE